MTFKIGTLARRTGTSAPTIRYYEQIGLLPRPDRRESGQRVCRMGSGPALRRATLPTFIWHQFGRNLMS